LIGVKLLKYQPFNLCMTFNISTAYSYKDDKQYNCRPIIFSTYHYSSN